MSIVEIEAAITQLPSAELAELMAWLQQYKAEAWDRQIEDDADAGRLDAVLAEAEKEYSAGLARPL